MTQYPECFPIHNNRNINLSFSFLENAFIRINIMCSYSLLYLQRELNYSKTNNDKFIYPAKSYFFIKCNFNIPKLVLFSLNTVNEIITNHKLVRQYLSIQNHKILTLNNFLRITDLSRTDKLQSLIFNIFNCRHFLRPNNKRNCTPITVLRDRSIPSKERK